MIRIDKLEPRDRPEWEELFQLYAEFYGRRLEQGATENVWSWIFDEENGFRCDVARAENYQVVGFVHYQLMHQSLTGAMTCYLSDLFVSEDGRRSGVGRALFDHVHRVANTNSWPSVRLLTQENNLNARRIYEDYGHPTDFLFYSLKT